jgi:(p)ppGpp synthase/HD superfamily hydrolase
MANLERAIAIAVESHSGQTDKVGQPYILHPLRVMLSLDSEDERIVGVLHDVVEDCDIGFQDLRAHGFHNTVIEALRGVTKRPDEEGSDAGYRAFVERAGTNSISRKVKIADLMDNLDVTRLETVREKDSQRITKYLDALRYLQNLK